MCVCVFGIKTRIGEITVDRRVAQMDTQTHKADVVSIDFLPGECFDFA